MADGQWKPGHFLKKGAAALKGSSSSASSPALADSSSTLPATPPAVPTAAAAAASSVPTLPRTDKMTMVKSEPFYLNIVVVDSSAAVDSQVQGKLGEGFWGKAASNLAKKVVNESKIATKVATQLAEKIPVALSEKGITLECIPRFQHGSFIVMRAQVMEVTPVQLVTLAKGEAFGASFAQMLGSFESLDLKDAMSTVQERVNEKVNVALLEKLAEILPVKLQEQGIITKISAKPEREQAEFFFDFMARIQPPPAGASAEN